jgi:hypothetical protein
MKRRLPPGSRDGGELRSRSLEFIGCGSDCGPGAGAYFFGVKLNNPAILIDEGQLSIDSLRATALT